jgi:hypothetical protein
VASPKPLATADFVPPQELIPIELEDGVKVWRRVRALKAEEHPAPTVGSYPLKPIEFHDLGEHDDLKASLSIELGDWEGLFAVGGQVSARTEVRACVSALR